MDFIKYSSLTNVSPKILQLMITAGLAGGTFAAFEKIHGCNFSAILRKGQDPVWARREDALKEGESFYQYEFIAKRYADKLSKVFKFLVDVGLATEDSVVQVYGEYAGTHENGAKIQKEVDYGSADWYIFDIKVDGKYMVPYATYAAALATNMLHVPLLKLGTLNECMAVPNDLQSTVKSMRERCVCEVVPGTDNIAEGTVVRAWGRVDYFHNGKLAVIKNKNTKFKGKKTPTVVVIKDLSEADNQSLAEAKSYLTKPRLDNVLSHIGDSLTAHDFGRVMGKFAQDAMKAFEEDTEKKFFEHFDDPARCKKQFMNEAAILLREVWVELVTGE